MTDFVLNFAPIRFLPNRHTGEFINVGVVVCCPEIDWFDFKIESAKTKRALDFFPNLDLAVFTRSLQNLETELTRHRKANDSQLYAARLEPKAAEPRIAWFRHLIQPRDSMTYFGEPGVTISPAPRVALMALFNEFVPTNIDSTSTVV